MQLQLLTAALRRKAEFKVTSTSLDADLLLQTLQISSADVLVFAATGSASSWDDMAVLRRLRMTSPNVAQILLVETVNREIVVNAFRSAVRGLFCFGELPFRLLCKCIQVVHRGQIWVTAQQVEYLLELLTCVPSLRVVNQEGSSLLTPREEQVVALVAEGLSNKEIAQELALSEHTIKSTCSASSTNLVFRPGWNSSYTPSTTASSVPRNGCPGLPEPPEFQYSRFRAPVCLQ